jgi:hypothetical protein
LTVKPGKSEGTGNMALNLPTPLERFIAARERARKTLERIAVVYEKLVYVTMPGEYQDAARIVADRARASAKLLRRDGD